MADQPINFPTEEQTNAQFEAAGQPGTAPLPVNLASQEAPVDTHVNVVDPEGELVSIPSHQLQTAVRQGYRQAEAQDIEHYKNKGKYEGPAQTAMAGLEGLASGLTGGLSTGLETATLGIPGATGITTNEDIRGRREEHPVARGLGEVGSLLVPSSLIAKGMTKSGEAAVKFAGLAGESALSRIGSATTKAAVENMMFQGGDEISKMLSQDPNQSVETAVADIGLSGLVGGVIGGGIGAVSPLWKASKATQLGQEIDNYKGRMNYHLNNPDPVGAVGEEMHNFYNGVKQLADEQYGPMGLKAQDIAKSMPEMSDKIANQATSMGQEVKTAIDKMVKKPYDYPERLTSKLLDDFTNYDAAIANAKSPGEIFNAAQDLKQTLQGYAKFGKRYTPVDAEYSFTKDAKDLAFKLRNSLEDSSVWGKAAERQKAINKAFVEYLPALKDFEKRFTTEMGGERVVDPAKINTYMNQLGKPNAELKQQMLKTYLDASEKYKDVIAQSHANLGLENPALSSSLAMVRGTLKESTLGSKLADYVANKGLSAAAGSSAGAYVGNKIGNSLSLPHGIGAILGQHALGPFFTSVLPMLARPLMDLVTNSSGFKAAVDLAIAAAKGESVISKGAKNVFNATREVLPQSAMPNEATRRRLDKQLGNYRDNPDSMFDMGGHTGHYMPGHATAIGSTASNAIQYLNGLRPISAPQNPLDSKIEPSSMQKSAYNRALDIAEQPLIVLNKIQNGSLTPQDTSALKAMYPNLYARLVNKLTNEMVAHIDKGETVPYKTRMSLSLFMGQPLDGTMTPQAIMAAQPQSGQNQPQNGQQQEPQQRQKHSTTALNKLPGMYKTPGQGAEEDKASRS